MAQNRILKNTKCDYKCEIENNIGQTCAVMKQPYIPNYEYTPQELIETELNKRGFIKTVLGKGVNFSLTGHTNGLFELTDAKPQNVLKSESGILYFIDLEISCVLIE